MPGCRKGNGRGRAEGWQAKIIQGARVAEPNDSLEPTSAAILVFRSVTSTQAALAAQAKRSALLSSTHWSLNMKALFWSIPILLMMHLTIGTLRAGDAKDEIAKLSKEYDAAIKARDVKALGKLLDAEGQFIDEDGKVLDKKGQIASIVDDNPYDSAVSEGVTIRVVGNTAIETGTWIGTGKKDGKAFRKQNRYTCIWEKKGDTWVVIAEQATPITSGK